MYRIKMKWRKITPTICKKKVNVILDMLDAYIKLSYAYWSDRVGVFNPPWRPSGDTTPHWPPPMYASDTMHDFLRLRMAVV